MARRYTRDRAGRFASTGGRAGRKKLNAKGSPKIRKAGREMVAGRRARGMSMDSPFAQLATKMATRGTRGLKQIKVRPMPRPKRRGRK